MAAVEDDALTPPKPFFLADSRSSSASGISDTASDADSQSDRTPPVAPRAPSRPRAYRNHLRRSSMAAPDSPDITPPMSQSQSDHGHSGHWSHNDSPTLPSRAPPSSFAFPFQAYPGNPDPGLAIPGLGRVSRRASYESFTQSPYSPFFPPQQITPPVPPPGNSIYRNSVASASALPRVSSAQNFRAPFLAPSSRPSSSLWSPPTYQHALISPNQSSTALPLSKTKPPLPSTRLPTKLLKQDKPWLTKPEPRTRLAWWLTFGCMLLGLAASGVVCWRGISGVRKIDPSKLCLVMDDSFSSSDIDDSNWSRDVELGGFGNGEFEMTTSSSNNAYISGGQLYIHPTLTTEDLPDLNIFDGSNYTLPDCTTTNKTACSVSSNILRSAVINPVLSARLNTKGKRSIKYGKVEVRAKLPRGDWLWPAIWMLPENDTYGAWPLSGEIDILEARGNAQPYPQGSDTVRSTLSYGPLPALTQRLFGWVQSKRTPFD
ncbi:concanavalin A-like lectin/glucanase domain-containing protein, partial [Infundibulicybe gibba]